MKTKIIEVIYLGDLKIRIIFDNQHQQQIDIGDFIRKHPHPQYNKYLDPKKFKKFTIENGNVVWGKNWDLVFPIDQLYAGELL